MKSAIHAVLILRQAIKLKKYLERIIKSNKVVYVTDKVSYYRKIWENAAKNIGAQIADLSEDIWEIKKNSWKIRVNNYKVPLDDPVVLSIAGDKELCHRLLKEVGVAIPHYTAFSIYEIEKGIEFFKNSRKPLVVKPAAGTSGGRGVSSFISTYREFIAAIALSSTYDRKIIVEEMLPGELYRLLFLNKKMIHAARRTGIRVTGDGKSTILQLLINQMELYPGRHDKKNKRSIIKDKDIQLTLNSQSLNIHTVPATGKEVLARSYPAKVKQKAEINSVYTDNATHMICESIIEAATKAVAHLDLEFAGVDIVTIDPGKPLGRGTGAIIEINSTPGLHHHYDLSGQSNTDQPAELVLEYLFNKKST